MKIKIYWKIVIILRLLILPPDLRCGTTSKKGWGSAPTPPMRALAHMLLLKGSITNPIMEPQTLILKGEPMPQGEDLASGITYSLAIFYVQNDKNVTVQTRFGAECNLDNLSTYS